MKTFHAKDFSSPLALFGSPAFWNVELPCEIDTGGGSTFTMTKDNIEAVCLGCTMASSWPKKETNDT